MRRHRHVYLDFSHGIAQAAGDAPRQVSDDQLHDSDDVDLGDFGDLGKLGVPEDPTFGVAYPGYLGGIPAVPPSPHVNTKSNGTVAPKHTSPTPPAAVDSADPKVLSLGGSEREPLPTVPDERRLAQKAVDLAGGVFRTLQDAKPPPASTTLVVDDEGAAGPDVIRLSMYNIPATPGLRERTQIPLGLIVQPFAHAVVPHSDFSEWTEGPPRCVRCRGYVNPATQFVAGGSKFVCNLCGFANKTPQLYWQPLGADGRRIDWRERPELAAGVYDLEVPAESWGFGGDGMSFVFVIDVGAASVARNIPAIIAAVIKETVAKMAPPTRVSIITYSQGVNLVRFGTETSYEILVQRGPGLQDMVAPPDVFTAPDAPALIALLDSFTEIADGLPGSCYGSAVELALALLPTGGRIMSVVAALPSDGPGALFRRDPAVSGTGTHGDPEKELFGCAAPYYTRLARNMRERGVGCDVFAFPQGGYIDMAALGLPAYESGGRHHTYARFVAERDARAFAADWLAAALDPVAATQADVAIRVSTGLQVEHAPETRYGFMDSNSTLMATLVHDGPRLDAKLDVHIQVAVLYSSAHDGGRRVRVINALAGVTDAFKPVLKFIDCDAVVGLLIRAAVDQLPRKPLHEIRKSLLHSTTAIFAAARRHAGHGIPPSQLLMPAALRELAPLMLAAVNGIALGPRAFSTDSRVQYARRIAHAPPRELQLALYPAMVSVPDGRPLRARKTDVRGNVVLACDGERLWLYAPEGHVLDAILGPNPSAYLDELPILATAESERARELAAELIIQSGNSWLPLQLAREGWDGAVYQFGALLVEEAVASLPAYVDFIQQVHRKAKVDI